MVGVGCGWEGLPAAISMTSRVRKDSRKPRCIVVGCIASVRSLHTHIIFFPSPSNTPYFVWRVSAYSHRLDRSLYYSPPPVWLFVFTPLPFLFLWALFFYLSVLSFRFIFVSTLVFPLALFLSFCFGVGFPLALLHWQKRRKRKSALKRCVSSFASGRGECPCAALHGRRFQGSLAWEPQAFVFPF